MGEGGKFAFKGDLLQNKGFYYALLPGDVVIKLLLDDDQVFTFTADANDIDQTAKIEGNTIGIVL
ncbi:MAG: hypothetical protein R2771_09060 [Saprospiraceae bacterium]